MRKREKKRMKVVHIINIMQKDRTTKMEIVSLFLVAITLIVATVSLLISYRVYQLASKDYLPDINFEVTENSMKVTNETKDLFSISEINYIQIDEGGFEEMGTEYYVQVPLVTKSVSNYINVGEGNKKTYEIKFTDPNPLAYVREVNPDYVKEFRDKLEKEYSIDNKTAYAIPYLQEGYSIIEIVYEDRFHNMKRISYKYYHLHGIGDFRKEVISDEEKNKIISQIDIPEFETFDAFWKYCSEKYREKYDY